MNRYDIRKELLRMVQKYLAGKATPAEETFLKAYYDFFERDDDILQNLRNEEKRLLGQKMEQGFWEKVDRWEHQRVRALWPRIAAAASVLIVLSIGFYAVRHNKHTTENKVAKIIPAGANGAILTLANGHKIVLEKARNGQLAAGVKKANDSLLVYTNAAAAVAYNTLETPEGKQYSVELPDGSKAWLNAASSLRYPTRFDKNNRTVELSGEAYFEVVHNSASPFRVKTAVETIEDIGTHFDVNAYADEPVQKTTLVEGLVKVAAGDEIRKLQPGQQAAFANNELTVKEVDVQEATAWQKGYFYFDHADIKEVMRQIARWYKVKVTYEGTIPQKQFKGKIYRNVNLQEALKILAYFNVHFRIQGDTVIVSA